MNLNKLFAAVTNGCILAMFFLVPAFFLPLTTNVLDINKQSLLVILTLLALVSWLGSMVLAKRLTFRSGWVNVIPAAFLTAVLASSLFSLAGYQTWVGSVSQEYTSFLTTAMYVLAFYLLANNAGSVTVQRGAFLSLLASAALSGLLGVLSLFNVVHLPFVFAQSNAFNTVGTVNALATFLSTVMFMGIAAWLVSAKKDAVLPAGSLGMVMRGLIAAVTVFALAVMFVADFWVLWVVNVVAVLVLAAFSFVHSASFSEPRRFGLPLFVLLVSVLLIFARSPLRANIPALVSPSYGTSWDIAKQTLSQGVPRLLLGSGPGTFGYDYAMYRPAEVNGTIFWNTHFDRAKSHALTNLTTLGVLGFALWLAAMLSGGALGLSRLLRERDGDAWKMTYVYFAGWSVLFLSHLLYASNLTLSFLLWAMTGMLAAQALRGIRTADFGQSPRLGLLSSFAFVVVGVGALATLFITGSRYAAEGAFAKAIEHDQAGGSIDDVIAELGKAVSYNSLSDVYYRNLSSSLLMKARQQVAEAGGAGLSPEQSAAITASVSAAVNAASRATALEPNNVDNWVVRGSIYRDVMSFVTGAEDYAAVTFQQALALEPNNPSHYTNLGRVYVSVADRARLLKDAEDEELAATAAKAETDQLAAAEQAFLTAIQTKLDYAPAHYYLASVYERQGRVEEAITRLAALRDARPNDVGLGFQLAVLYMKTEQYDLSRKELERIVAIFPTYSNALWYLSALYELDGDEAKALSAANKVLELNPDNQAAKQRVKNLRSGVTGSGIPEPVEEGENGATDSDDDVSGDGDGIIESDTE